MAGWEEMLTHPKQLLQTLICTRVVYVQLYDLISLAQFIILMIVVLTVLFIVMFYPINIILQ
jgi:hypothetical protein